MAGILPEGVMKLEGKDMGSVECIDNAYLVIEDGIITEYGGMNGLCGSGFQNRATPLAAGGGNSSEGVGGVVLQTTPHCFHQVATPETDLRLWVFCINSFHEVGSV